MNFLIIAGIIGLIAYTQRPQFMESEKIGPENAAPETIEPINYDIDNFKPISSYPANTIAQSDITVSYEPAVSGPMEPAPIELLDTLPAEVVLIAPPAAVSEPEIMQAAQETEIINNEGQADMNGALLLLGVGAAYIAAKSSEPAPVTPPASELPPTVAGPVTPQLPPELPEIAVDPPIVDVSVNYNPGMQVNFGANTISVGQIFGNQVAPYDYQGVENHSTGYSVGSIAMNVALGIWDASVIDHYLYHSEQYARYLKSRGDSYYNFKDGFGYDTVEQFMAALRADFNRELTRYGAVKFV